MVSNTHCYRTFKYEPQPLSDAGVPLYSCTAALEEFENIIPLPVYGLPEGEYGYKVNGGFSGTFSLESDNILTGLTPRPSFGKIIFQFSDQE